MMSSWDAERLEVIEAVRGDTARGERDPARFAACADLLRNAGNTLDLETGKWSNAGSLGSSGKLRQPKSYAAF